MKKGLYVLAILGLGLSLAACGGGSSSSSLLSSSISPSTSQETKELLINFNTNGGNPLPSIVVTKETYVGLPTPTKKNNVFEGWFTDESLTVPYEYVPDSSGEITIHAKWRELEITYIKTVDEFKNIKNNLKGRYELSTSLDFANEVIAPIGNDDNPFEGSFDGAGFKISNYLIKDDKYNALFGYVTGYLDNINVNTSFTYTESDDVYVALLAGHTYDANIVNCTARGSIVLNNTAAEEVSIVGGLIGYSEVSYINKCFAQVNIETSTSATIYLGGLIGYNGGGSSQSSIVENSYTKSSNLNASTTGFKGSPYVGGVVGYNFGLVNKCFSHDDSIVARTKSDYIYAAGVVADNNGGSVTNCFGGSDVSVFSETGNTFRGLVIGRNFHSTQDDGNGTMFNNYGSSVAKTAFNVNAQYAKTTAHEQVVTEIAYLENIKSSDWYKTALGYDNFLIKDGYYPSLSSEYKKITATGDIGSPEAPIQITDAAGLMNIDPSKSYILANNIDMKGVTITPIGTYFNQYRGVFDGNGFSIKNLSFAKESGSLYTGLFGFVNGLIKNLKVDTDAEYVAVSTNIQYVGGVAAFVNKSLIEDCSANVDIDITSNGQITGGVVGYAENSMIYQCFANGEIKGKSLSNTAYFGGLVGEIKLSTIDCCYAKVNLEIGGKTIACVGGLLGKNDGDVSNAYTIGNIKINEASTTAYAGGLVGLNKRGIVENAYTKVVMSTSANAQSKLLGGLIGSNESDLYNCFYNVNAEIAYSCGHSPILVNVTRVNDSEMKDLAGKISPAFYTGEDNMPHLNFEKEGK